MTTGSTDDNKPSQEDDKNKKPDDTSTGDETDVFDEARAREAIRKKNSEAANLRSRVKELEEAERKLKELEDKDKSESQRLTEEKATAEKNAQEAKLSAMRLEVALEKGLTSVQARRLVGTTKEELEADADELLESFGAGGDEGDKKKTPPGDRPKERLRGGGDPTKEPDPDVDDIVNKVRRN